MGRIAGALALPVSSTFEAESSADSILQADRICRSTQVSSKGLQVENLRYSRTGVLRYAFGVRRHRLTYLASTVPAAERTFAPWSWER